jgi:hypothetical protein
MYNIRDFGRDTAINKILSQFGMNNSLIIYNLISCNPIEVIAQVLMAKFGLTKTIITIILIFLL